MKKERSWPNNRSNRSQKIKRIGNSSTDKGLALTFRDRY